MCPGLLTRSYTLYLETGKGDAPATTTKKTKTAASTSNTAKPAAKKASASTKAKTADSGFQSDDEAVDIVDDAPTAGARCPTCNKPGYVAKDAPSNSSPVEEDKVDFTGDFAWFVQDSKQYKSLHPPENPTAADWAEVHAGLTQVLSTNPSHGASFSLKLGYRGKRVYLRNRCAEAGNMAESVVAGHGAEILGGYVGDVEFTEEDVPAHYGFDVDLSCVHGYEARLHVPPKMGVRGHGTFKMRRVWVDAGDASKELFEGAWDLAVSADDKHTKGRYGMDDDEEEARKLFWAVRHTRVAGEDEDEHEEDGEESCFY